MKLKDEILKKLENCEWLSRCGMNDEFNFEVEWVTTKSKVYKEIKSNKWGNTCLEANGDMNVYLFKNHVEIQKTWNDNALKLNKEFMEPLIEKINTSEYIDKIDDKILLVMRANVMQVLMYELFHEYYSSEFYDKMFQIYLAGHIPCGWSGKYPEGKFIVY